MGLSLCQFQVEKNGHSFTYFGYKKVPVHTYKTGKQQSQSLRSEAVTEVAEIANT